MIWFQNFVYICKLPPQNMYKKSTKTNHQPDQDWGEKRVLLLDCMVIILPCNKNYMHVIILHIHFFALGFSCCITAGFMRLEARFAFKVISKNKTAVKKTWNSLGWAVLLFEQCLLRREGGGSFWELIRVCETCLCYLTHPKPTLVQVIQVNSIIFYCCTLLEDFLKWLWFPKFEFMHSTL